MTFPWHTNIDSARAAGFDGFSTIRELREGKLQSVPEKMGVYVIFRAELETPKFLEQSTGGRFKGRDPSVSMKRLQDQWVSNAAVVYIGKAGAPGGSATLRSRLKQYLDFGTGRPVGHWGGRLIWHLPSADNLVVCWKQISNEVPRRVEKHMIKEFVASYGMRPFANLTN